MNEFIKQSNKMLGLPRPHLSWSQISSLAWSVEQWKQSYIYNQRQDSIYLTFGKKFHEALEYRNKKVPKYLENIRRQIPSAEQSEVELKVEIDGIPIVGILDGSNPTVKGIDEYKTGKTEQMKSWRGQLSLYSLLHFQKFGVLPNKIRLFWARTAINENDQLVFTGEVREYSIEIGMRDILEITQRIIKAHAQIKELVERERDMFGKLPFEK